MGPEYPGILHMQGRRQSRDEGRQKQIASWLAALLGAEHVSLLVGSGLGMALSGIAGVPGTGMDKVSFDGLDASERVEARAKDSAQRTGRGEPNIEDQLRAALELYEGLHIFNPFTAQPWRERINEALAELANGVLAMEQGLRQEFGSASNATGPAARVLLSRFLMSFAGRPPARERPRIFTTNYDRLIEYGADQAGIRVLDRFVGSLEPVFRASRLDIDMHFNPPGIRGEPRYMEGVVHLSKLHGSLDWRFDEGRVVRTPMAFGATGLAFGEGESALDRLMIYPNAAKDVETLAYPYAELFRDFAAATCRPNAVLFTYGYGFGDDHINRVIKDMLTLSSTHLVVISHDENLTRIDPVIGRAAPDQYTLLLGEHYGDLGTLVEQYLPYLGADQLYAEQRQRNDRIDLKPTADGRDPKADDA